MNHKIIVTGATGQVGKEVVLASYAAGFEPIALGSRELNITEEKAVHEAVALHQEARFLVNCAGYTAVDQAEEEVDQAYRINAKALSILGNACAAKGITFIHLSTDYIFSGYKKGAYTEQDLATPLNVYGQSKKAGEDITRLYPHHFILRSSWVFSQFGDNFVKTMMRLANERAELRIVNDQQGCPTAANHIAEVIIKIMLQKLQGNPHFGTYHYCDLPPVTWFEFAQKIIDRGIALGKINPQIKVTAITSEQFPTQAQRPQNSVLDCAKIKRDFGIEQRQWIEALDDVIRSYR